MGVVYVLVGCGFALFVLRRRGAARTGEALLALVFWPLCAPFLVHGASAWRAGADPIGPFDQAQASALAGLLPGGAVVRTLADRLRAAALRIEEIDRLLARPEFSADDARARREAFAAAGDARGAAAAASRLQNVERLRALRDRSARQLDQLRELLGQLRVQAEVVRLSGSSGDGTRELVEEILARVEGLDAALDDGPPSSA